LKNIAK